MEEVEEEEEEEEEEGRRATGRSLRRRLAYVRLLWEAVGDCKSLHVGVFCLRENGLQYSPV